MPLTIDVIRREHRYISAVVHCLEQVLKDMKADGLEVDPAFFRAAIEYIQDFPDRFHHPKEDKYLFKALLRRRPDLKPLLDQLSEEHRKGEREIVALRWKAEAFAKDGASAFDDFYKAALDYIDFQRAHLVTEEEQVIPAALASLRDEDWEKIDAAFIDNDDPIFGTAPRRHFQALITEIVNRAPAPHGVAERVGQAVKPPEQGHRRRWI